MFRLMYGSYRPSARASEDKDTYDVTVRRRRIESYSRWRIQHYIR